MKIRILIMLLALGLSGCEGILGLDEYDVELDTAPVEDGDYWVDGYCPDDDSIPASADCGGVTDEGCCTADGSVIYCQSGSLYCISCGDHSGVCSWNVDGYYDCSPSGQDSDPGGAPMFCEE